MRKNSTITTSLDTITGLVDAVPVDSLTSLDAPDLSAVADVLSDASALVADTAQVVGRRGRRIASRSAVSAWRNREAVLTIAVVAVVILAIASFVKRSGGDADAPDIA